MSSRVHQFIERNLVRIVVYAITIVFAGGMLWATYSKLPDKVMRLEESDRECRTARAIMLTKMDILLKRSERWK